MALPSPAISPHPPWLRSASLRIAICAPALCRGMMRRIIAGGDDIEVSNDAARDALIGAKAGVIAAKLEAMLGIGPGSGQIAIDRKWAATFGASPDGLPAIGRTSLMPHVWLSAGYGGNGIAFAGLAAEILERELGGDADPERDCFDPYRFSRG